MSLAPLDPIARERYENPRELGNPFQRELQRTVSQNGPSGMPEKDMFGKPWSGGGSVKPPTSNTMPVRDQRPQSSVDSEFMRGTQAGQSMSWMQKPGAVTAGGGQAFSPQTYTGFTPKHAMEGFDFSREQNTGKSAKDAFAYLSNQAPPPPINDKAALGAWFSQYIKPGMDALGHNVSSVDGDKFRFKNWQGEYDVDYGRGAGADGGALAWQAENAGGVPQVQGAYQPMAQQQGPVMPGQSDLMAQILESLQNQQQPDPQDLLLQQLR